MTIDHLGRVLRVFRCHEAVESLAAHNHRRERMAREREASTAVTTRYFRKAIA